MTRTYVDAGVLIAAARGQADLAARAMEVLDDPQREFAGSVFLQLELLPKPIYYGNTLEAEFYEEFFAAVTHWSKDHERIAGDALQEACAAGLAALDALHVAAAIAAGATEFVTTERRGKPIHRVKSIQVVTIHPNPGA
jgi:predicted nucleic acid-binding protein